MVSDRPTRKRFDIPTPIVTIVADYDQDVPATFVKPHTYVRHQPHLVDPDQQLEYNLDVEDEEWLRQRASETLDGRRGPDANMLERMIDLAEKETARRGGPPTLAQLEDLFFSRLQFLSSDGKAVGDVRNYWLQKRTRLRKPLLRRFWPPTSIHDNDPHHVFRPREKERYKLRKHRKNDLEAFQKMQQLRDDMLRARELLEKVLRREQRKRELVDYTREMLEQAVYDLTDSSGKPRRLRVNPRPVRDRALSPRCPWRSVRALTRFAWQRVKLVLRFKAREQAEPAAAGEAAQDRAKRPSKRRRPAAEDESEAEAEAEAETETEAGAAKSDVLCVDSVLMHRAADLHPPAGSPDVVIPAFVAHRLGARAPDAAARQGATTAPYSAAGAGSTAGAGAGADALGAAGNWRPVVLPPFLRPLSGALRAATAYLKQPLGGSSDWLLGSPMDDSSDGEASSTGEGAEQAAGAPRAPEHSARQPLVLPYRWCASPAAERGCPPCSPRPQRASHFPFACVQSRPRGPWWPLGH